MSSNIAIQVKELTKSYQIYANPKHRLLQMLFRGKRQYYKDFSALSNVSFEVVKGDSVGILGHNGAGKSTLLQLLTGTLTATSGTIKTNGRIAALLELGAGFNPEFTGKENVYMNAAILGLNKREIDEKYDDILKFADIGDFIHRPVKTYSSGMYVRLAFSVAVHIEPEILIIDEALAVGDIRFQMKCLEYMEGLKKTGTTILFVSHSPEQVKRFCNKAIWLNKGEVKDLGDANLICDRYKDWMSFGGENEVNSVENKPQIKIPARITKVSLDKSVVNTGDDLTCEVTYEVFDENIHGLLMGVAIYKPNRDYIFGANTHLDEVKIPILQGEHKVKYKLKNIPLLPGYFDLDVGIFTEKSLVSIDYATSAKRFEVHNDYQSEGLVNIEHNWII